MEYLIIGIVGTYLWIAYEMWRAPQMDDNGRIVKPGKKLSDLWRKQN
jgi:hypothetical protein